MPDADRTACLGDYPRMVRRRLTPEFDQIDRQQQGNEAGGEC